jgi:hypothetical protein
LIFSDFSYFPRLGRLESLGVHHWKWSVLREYIDLVRQRLAGTAWLNLAAFVENYYEKQRASAIDAFPSKI